MNVTAKAPSIPALQLRAISPFAPNHRPALGCEFAIPKPSTGSIDCNKVNVRYDGTSGMQDLSYVGTADKCDATRGGWYHDANPTSGGIPTRVHLCEATCSKAKGDTGGKVELLFDCVTKID